jgi:hypothetical protein
MFGYRKNKSFKFDEIIVMVCGAQEWRTWRLLEGKKKEDYFHLFFMTNATFGMLLWDFCFLHRQQRLT